MSTTETFENGDTFEGEFVKGKPFRGTYTFSNGDVFEGVLAYGKQPQAGTLVYENGDTFIGTFSKGQPDNGDLLYPNGDLFRGEMGENRIRLNGLLYKYDEITKSYKEISYENGKHITVGGKRRCKRGRHSKKRKARKNKKSRRN
jgi:hypothetical protein